jgi:hypothetical protein
MMFAVRKTTNSSQKYEQYFNDKIKLKFFLKKILIPEVNHGF